MEQATAAAPQGQVEPLAESGSPQEHAAPGRSSRRVRGFSPAGLRSSLSSQPGLVPALVGAGITVGFSLASKLVRAAVGRGRKPKPVPSPARKSTARKSSAPSSPAVAFGSPVDPSTPTFLHKRPAQPAGKPASIPAINLAPLPSTSAPALEPSSSRDSDAGRDKPLPPSQISQQLKQLQEMQEENAKLRAFMQEFMNTSEKLQKLEDENKKLVEMQSALRQELEDVRSKQHLPTNGDELTHFKKMHGGLGPGIARSVCSDADVLAGMRVDTASLDGTQSVMDAGQRRKYGSMLSRIAAAVGMAPITENSRSIGGADTPLDGTPQPSPRTALAASRRRSGAPLRDSMGGAGTQQQDVVRLLEAFGGGM